MRSVRRIADDYIIVRNVRSPGEVWGKTGALKNLYSC